MQPHRRLRNGSDQRVCDACRNSAGNFRHRCLFIRVRFICFDDFRQAAGVAFVRFASYFDGAFHGLAFVFAGLRNRSLLPVLFAVGDFYIHSSDNCRRLQVLARKISSQLTLKLFYQPHRIIFSENKCFLKISRAGELLNCKTDMA